VRLCLTPISTVYGRIRPHDGRGRVEQFRDQGVSRRLAGELTEEQFKQDAAHQRALPPLHAYMLRIAIPYGRCPRGQLRKLADIAASTDRGYGPFHAAPEPAALNWIQDEDAPDAWRHSPKSNMHACRPPANGSSANVTADPCRAASMRRSRIRASVRRRAPVVETPSRVQLHAAHRSNSPSPAAQRPLPRLRCTISGCAWAQTRRRGRVRVIGAAGSAARR